VLDEVESRWHATLAEHGRALRVRLDDPAISARASAPVLREIADVLLDNAVRHGAGAVTVHARLVGGSLALDVADEGGLELDGEEVFTRRSDRAGGNGIGLVLARSLAHAEGGRLVLSRTNPTVFTLVVSSADDDGDATRRRS
jgi:signal transduction histidine kinase